MDDESNGWAECGRSMIDSLVMDCTVYIQLNTAAVRNTNSLVSFYLTTIATPVTLSFYSSHRIGLWTSVSLLLDISILPHLATSSLIDQIPTHSASLHRIPT